VLVPVTIGMAIRARTPLTASRLHRPVKAFSVIALAAIIAVAVIQEARDHRRELRRRGRSGPDLQPGQPAGRLRPVRDEVAGPRSGSHAERAKRVERDTGVEPATFSLGIEKDTE
jgi:hypothetical protein